RPAAALGARQQRSARPAEVGDDLDRLHVRDLRQTQPAILARDLDAERAQLSQPLDHRVRDLALPVDPIGVDVLAQKPLESLEKWLGPRDLLGVLPGVGMDQLLPQFAAEEVEN